MNNRYGAYQAANQTVSKTRQIVMLYDGIIRFLKQAGEAMGENRIEDRFKLLVKASDVVIGLQSCLDFDCNESVATSLYDYYTSVDARIMELQRTNSQEQCEALVADLKGMRELWHNIDQEAANAEVQPSVQAPAPVAEQKVQRPAAPADDISSVFVSA